VLAGVTLPWVLEVLHIHAPDLDGLILTPLFAGWTRSSISIRSIIETWVTHNLLRSLPGIGKPLDWFDWRSLSDPKTTPAINWPLQANLGERGSVTHLLFIFAFLTVVCNTYVWSRLTPTYKPLQSPLSDIVLFQLRVGSQLLVIIFLCSKVSVSSVYARWAHRTFQWASAASVGALALSTPCRLLLSALAEASVGLLYGRPHPRLVVFGEASLLNRIISPLGGSYWIMHSWPRARLPQDHLRALSICMFVP